MSPFSALIRSRKFLLLLLDTVVSIVLHFVGAYAPEAAGDVQFLIGALQPVFVMIIAAIAYEDAHKAQG